MKIYIEDDFDLYKIAYSGQCFRVRELDKNTYRFITGNNTVEITKPSSESSREFEVSCSRRQWDEVWHDYFDLDTDYSAIRAGISPADKYLKNAADIGAGIRILKQDKFETLISFIISQRKSIPAIKTSVERLCSLYGSNGFFPNSGSLANAPSSELSSCGLGYRVPYVQNAASCVADGDIDLESIQSCSDEELCNLLKTLNGVGDKVANCVALFAYHRVGRAPIDTWINKIINSEYNGINPFPSYGKYAGIMQQYMFYAAQHMKI